MQNGKNPDTATAAKLHTVLETNLSTRPVIKRCRSTERGFGGPGVAETNHMSKVQVYVVDDEPAVRKGLRLLLNRQPDLHVCGETDTGPEALRRIESLQPKLAIVDLTLKENNGLKATRQLR